MIKESLPTSVEQRKEKLSEAEEKTFDLLVVEHDESAIDMDDFKDIPRYAERLERDKANIVRKKANIKVEGTEPTKKARILEAIFSQQIELSNWFGNNTFTIVPAEYDDLFHGIDLALEIKSEKDLEYSALGIDVTSSAKALRNKLKTIKNHIADGTLTMIEYFHSDNKPDFYEVMKDIPQVVIGTEGRTIQELSELWMTAYGLPRLRQRSGAPALSPEAEQSQKRATKEAKEKLGNHRIQMLLLEEIKMQLAVFRRFAVEESKRRAATGQKELMKLSEKITSAARKIELVLNLINAILKEKGIPDREDVFKNNEDFVFQALSEAVNDFENL